MRVLHIDIETYCEKNLSQCGVYAYCDDDSFEILLFAYSFDNQETKIVDLYFKEKIPQEVIDALLDDKVTKTAFNAVFERICLSKYLKKRLSPTSWVCTQIQGAMLGLPLSLDKMGEILNIKNRKLKEGKDLIKFFTLKQEPSVKNNFQKRNLPEDNEDKWQDFKKYCIGDVNAEREISYRLRNFPISKEERELYVLDQEINDRGILIDVDFVNSAMKCAKEFNRKMKMRAYELTNLQNPASPSQIKMWLKSQDIHTPSLDKKTVQKLIEKSDGYIREVLEIRQILSKTSLKKYKAMEKSMCKDERLHGLFQFYGANRTGRWSGRLVQVQNLPQNHLENLDYMRNLVKNEKYYEIEKEKVIVSDILSQLIRTAFIPRKNYQFIVADFSAIEARVLSYLSCESWRMKVFETHGKIYESSASQMFKVPMEKITKESALRQKGKIAELALGYGGGIGALKSMGALEMGIKEEELSVLVNKWRNANSNITKFWYEVGRCAIKAVMKRVETRVGDISFLYKSDILFIKLPSKRSLCYVKPRIERNEVGRLVLTYEGLNKNRKWSRISTYGPKLVENIVQGISRDILSFAMMNLYKRGLSIVMHVHDEIVLEVEKDSVSVDEICKIMKKSPPWAKKLPLDVKGYSCEYYKKE